MNEFKPKKPLFTQQDALKYELGAMIEGDLDEKPCVFYVRETPRIIGSGVVIIVQDKNGKLSKMTVDPTGAAIVVPE